MAATQNGLLSLLVQSPPATMLGIVIGSDPVASPACKVKFAAGSDMPACVTWLKNIFIAWSGRKEQLLTVASDVENCTVEIKG